MAGTLIPLDRAPSTAPPQPCVLVAVQARATVHVWIKSRAWVQVLWSMSASERDLFLMEYIQCGVLRKEMLSQYPVPGIKTRPTSPVRALHDIMFWNIPAYSVSLLPNAIVCTSSGNRMRRRTSKVLVDQMMTE